MGWLLKPHDAQFGGAAPPDGEHDERADLDAQLAAHKGVMICVAAALVGPADAEDAAQEASLRAWRSWDELRDREASARGCCASPSTFATTGCAGVSARASGGRNHSTQEATSPRSTLTLAGHITPPRWICGVRSTAWRSRCVSRSCCATTLASTRRRLARRSVAPAATVRTRLRRALGLLQDALTTDPHLRAMRAQGSDTDE